MTAPQPHDPPTSRCPVCGARDWRAEAERARCGHCGLHVPATEFDPDAARRDLQALLCAGDVDAGRAQAFPGMDAYTLRTAASARGLGFEPADDAQADALARPHSALPGRGRLTRFAAAPVRVTLGTIAREADAALDHVARLRGRFVAAIVLLDAPGDGAPGDVVRRTAVARHPLDGDFAAQRNRVQALAPTRWVLQLDSDEEPDDDLLDTMDALTVQADRQGLVSIGLPRRNLVDGALSDLYPDVQYRLNRRDVRYVGRVHERPDLGGRWWRSMIAPAATLVHRLDGARVRERSHAYGSMVNGGDRPGDELALLRPFAA